MLMIRDALHGDDKLILYYWRLEKETGMFCTGFQCCDAYRFNLSQTNCGYDHEIIYKMSITVMISRNIRCLGHDKTVIVSH